MGYTRMEKSIEG